MKIEESLIAFQIFTVKGWALVWPHMSNTIRVGNRFVSNFANDLKVYYWGGWWFCSYKNTTIYRLGYSFLLLVGCLIVDICLSMSETVPKRSENFLDPLLRQAMQQLCYWYLGFEAKLRNPLLQTVTPSSVRLLSYLKSNNRILRLQSWNPYKIEGQGNL